MEFDLILKAINDEVGLIMQLSMSRENHSIIKDQGLCSKRSLSLSSKDWKLSQFLNNYKADNVT